MENWIIVCICLGAGLIALLVEVIVLRTETHSSFGCSFNVITDIVEQVDVKLDDGAQMPTRAHDLDAGYDIYSPFAFTINEGEAYTVDTGVHIAIPPLHVGMIKSKSGLNINHGIVTEGVIDSGYTGSIRIRVYKTCSGSYHVNKGDKLAQLVIMPISAPKLNEVDELEATERGDKGFGSSGK